MGRKNAKKKCGRRKKERKKEKREVTRTEVVRCSEPVRVGQQQQQQPSVL